MEILTKNGIYWHFDEEDSMMVIAYDKKPLNHMNESIVKENEIIEERKNLFIEQMSEYFQINAKCQIGVLKNDEYGVEISDEIKHPTGISIIDKKGIRFYSPKSSKIDRLI